MKTLLKLSSLLLVCFMTLTLYHSVLAEQSDISLYSYVMSTYSKSEYDLSLVEAQLDELVEQYTKASHTNQIVKSLESIRNYAETLDKEVNTSIDYNVELLQSSKDEVAFGIEEGLLTLTPKELSIKNREYEQCDEQIKELLKDKTSMVALLGHNNIDVIDTTDLEMSIEEKRNILGYNIDNKNTDFGKLEDLKRPFDAPVYLTSEAGYRVDPISGVIRYHEAVDYGMPVGTELYSLFNGTVVISDYTEDGYGNNVKIDCGNGITIHYAHMSARSVSVGDTVKQNQLIGHSGNTGYSTGPHLHLGIYYKGEILSVERLFD